MILIGTYRVGQFKAWKGYYNYPISDADPLAPEAYAKIDELWLFNGTKAQKTLVAEFVGVKTRQDLVTDYGYPAKGRGHGERYLLFKTKRRLQPSKTADGYFIRTKDFAGRSPKVAAQLKAFLKSPDRKDPALAAKLPRIVTELPKEKLVVGEAALQMEFLMNLFPGVPVACSVPRAVATGEMKVVDLFAGCGGMSLGFELAGFRTVLAVEKDAWASETYAFNHKNVKVVTEDITKIANPRTVCPDGGHDIFGVIGGPPCQGFSLSGGRDPKDPRNSLFMDYMRFVKEFNPSFFVMENVPGILSSVTKKGEPVRDVVVSVARHLGYNVHLMQLDASHYGVPQSRQRVFFVGIRNDYPFDPSLLHPIPTTKETPITLWEAISDLPRILACEGNERMTYPDSAANPYQKWCRENSQAVMNHVAMRHTERLVARFHVIGYGESAADVPVEHMQRKRGDASVISGKKYSQNNMRPYPDRPSPTVPASFQSNFVHPYIDRNFTAREGARLQSFPDSYVFKGKRTTMSWEKNLSQYQQIGNAVPPLLAKAIGEMVISYFKHIHEIKDHSEVCK